LTTTITKAEFLTYYENDQLYDILSTPIAVIAKLKPDPANPRPKAEVVVVNV